MVQMPSNMLSLSFYHKCECHVVGAPVKIVALYYILVFANY